MNMRLGDLVVVGNGGIWWAERAQAGAASHALDCVCIRPAHESRLGFIPGVTRSWFTRRNGIDDKWVRLIARKVKTFELAVAIAVLKR